MMRAYRDKWLSAVRCLYWISSKGSGYPAYTLDRVYQFLRVNLSVPFSDGLIG